MRTKGKGRKRVVGVDASPDEFGRRDVVDTSGQFFVGTLGDHLSDVVGDGICPRGYDACSLGANSIQECLSEHFGYCVGANGPQNFISTTSSSVSQGHLDSFKRKALLVDDHSVENQSQKCPCYAQQTSIGNGSGLQHVCLLGEGVKRKAAVVDGNLSKRRKKRNPTPEQPLLYGVEEASSAVSGFQFAGRDVLSSQTLPKETAMPVENASLLLDFENQTVVPLSQGLTASDFSSQIAVPCANGMVNTRSAKSTYRRNAVPTPSMVNTRSARSTYRRNAVPTPISDTVMGQQYSSTHPPALNYTLPSSSNITAEHVTAADTVSFERESFGTPISEPGRRRAQVPITGPPIEYIRFGPCNQLCRNCRALFWQEERLACSTATTGSLYHNCCLEGRVKLPTPTDYPAIIQQLFSSRHFLENIRAYNQMFAMTSLGAQTDESINVGRGPYIFKISGQIYHTIGRFCPEVDNPPRFLQLYIYDTHKEVTNRMSHFTNAAHTDLRPEIVDALIGVLDQNNALIQLFRTARDKLQENDVPEFRIRLFNVGRASQYELPTSNDIGAIIFGDDEETQTDFDVLLEAHSGQPQRINKLHAIYMSAQFPLLFIFGEHGYHLGLRYVNVESVSTRAGKRMSMKAFYSYQLHDKLGKYNIIGRGGRLFQQYVVTAYCSIEQNRMDYIRSHQADIRTDYLAGIFDAISRGDTDGSDVGSRIILPSSFTGGPRYMYSHYLDALAICRVHGNPSFFVTFTCNTRWPEIEDYMRAYPHLTAADRPDIVDRVFERKIHALIKYVRQRDTFGFLNAVLYTVEFQKRGLPHCHILLWVTQQTGRLTETDVDRYVSAELPNPSNDAEGFQVVSEFMIHGPCGSAFPNASCMQNRNSCKKLFPKQYCNSTFTDTNGYVHYRRRDIQMNVFKRGVQLDNGYVVPFNRELCMAFYAHINVEYCGWSMLIKYLFKYISKGTDRIVAQITRPIGEQHSLSATASTSSNANTTTIDEIKNFVDARFIGPNEACWRILGFDIHSRQPAVQILAVHLENMQSVSFRSRQTLRSVISDLGSRRTTLTGWLYFNQCSTLGHHLTYLQFPSEFIWSNAQKCWSPRRYLNKQVIGRMSYVHPNAGDLFYQRMLLSHQKGCRSFASIRTVNGETYATNRAACDVLGLLKDDEEWITAMQEASATATARELRALFSEILIFTDISNPVTLWSTFWKHMSDDIPMLLSRLLNMPFVFLNDPELEGGVLYELQSLLALHNRSLQEFGLPAPPPGLLNLFRNRSVMEEMNYDRSQMATESTRMVPLLNDQQRRVFQIIMSAISDHRQELVFVYGHGGTGKTFLWKAIISTVRAEGKIILAVASSGIASLLLPSGRTAHSRFKIPINLTDESMCVIKKSTQLAELLKQTEIVIWDEAPMNDKRCFEALDRTLRDILDDQTRPFGGKTMLLGGDFRQTLPVKKFASKEIIIASSIAESYLWSRFKVFYLLENMRLHRPGMTHAETQEVQGFSKWLLDIGDGNTGLRDEHDPQNTSWVRIPDMYCLPPTDEGLLQLIDFIYDEPLVGMSSASDFQKKAIVCPKNQTADQINDQILATVQGVSELYISVDEATPIGNDGGASELLYPHEYLNSLKFPGIPAHRLELKIGVPIMLLRNLNLTGGLCNGTRMIVTQMLTRVIEAKIITGTRMGEKVFLPRIVLTVKEEKMPFVFKRRQFPIKICYAMTINKSQGQSLERIGIYLPEPVFGHGQLYVALSRATSPTGLRMIIGDQPGQPPNTTKNIVYKDFLSKISNTQTCLIPHCCNIFYKVPGKLLRHSRTSTGIVIGFDRLFSGQYHLHLEIRKSSLVTGLVYTLDTEVTHDCNGY